MRKTNHSTGLRVLQYSMTTPPTYKLQRAWFALITFMMVSISTYAQQPKWSLHNSEVDYITGINGNLPASVSPDHIQNALWDDNGNLQFYVADGDIFNKNGSSMLLQPPTTDQGYWIDRCSYDKSELGYAEVALVPVPQTCNEFYVIFTTLGWDNSILPQDLSYYDDSGKFFLIYFRVDMDLNNGNGAIVPYPNPSQTNEHWCQGHNIIELTIAASREFDNDWGNSKKNWETHSQLLLGVTPENDDNKRYLFVTSFLDLNIFEISNTGISFMKAEMGDALQSVRGELEVFEREDEYVLAFPTVDLSIDQNSNKSLMMFIHLDKQSLSQTDFYFFDFYQAASYNFFPVAKGLEFSQNGNYLYCTLIRLEVDFGDGSTYGPPVLNNLSSHLGHFWYDAATNRYLFNPSIIFEENGDLDIGFGMIERGTDNKLYIAGNNSLSTLDDSNDPASTFTYGAHNYPNQLTFRSTTFANNDLRRYLEASYLLIDQQDQEENISTKFNQWPAIINSPCSDFTTVTSQINANWVWVPNASSSAVFPDPCNPNGNPDINIDPNSRPGDGDPLLFENTDEVSLEGPGMLYFFYSSGGCCHYETITIAPWGVPSPQLSWVFTNNGSTVDLTVTSSTHPLIAGYNWTLEKWDGSQWVVVNTVNNHGAVWSLSGLNVLTDYKISLTTIDNSQYPPCLYAMPQPIEINTGGRIGTFKGVAEMQEINH